MPYQGESTAPKPPAPKGPKITQTHKFAPDGTVVQTHAVDMPHGFKMPGQLMPTAGIDGQSFGGLVPQEILPGGMHGPPPAPAPRPSLLLGGKYSVPVNPQLPQAPLGAYTDAQFEADRAQIESTFRTEYAKLLKQLGYMDEQGNVVPGSAEIGYNRNQDDLARAIEEATQNQNDAATRGGTWFSGRRPENIANATYDSRQEASRQTADLPGILAGLYNQLLGLIGGYNNDLNVLLAQAAGRRPPGAGTGPGPDTTPTTNTNPALNLPIVPPGQPQDQPFGHGPVVEGAVGPFGPPPAAIGQIGSTWHPPGVNPQDILAAIGKVYGKGGIL